MRPQEFINQIDDEKIVAAIRDAEGRTSGEIRVFVTREKPADAVAAAKVQFTKLGMNNTKERNGVLIFVAPEARTFAIIGDESIHTRCGEQFWTEIAGEMSIRFRGSDFTGGITSAISRAGEILGTCFPRAADDKNELPDQVDRD